MHVPYHSAQQQGRRIVPELIFAAEDEGVLEAERELALYLSRQPGPSQGFFSGGSRRTHQEPPGDVSLRSGRPRAQGVAPPPQQVQHASSSSTSRQGDTDRLAAEVQHLGQMVLEQDSMIQALWAELSATPAEDQSALQQENAQLETEAAESEAQLEKLRAEQRSLSAEAVECRRIVQGLQQEREILLARVSEAQRNEASARDATKVIQMALAAERTQGDQQHRAGDVELSQREKALAEAEARAQIAAKQLEKLRAQGTLAEGAEAEAVARAAAAEAEKWSLERQRLEARLLQEEEGILRAAKHDRDLSVELATAREEVQAMELATQALALEVTESEQKTEATERKAKSVARELLQTSEAVAQLRQDVAAGQGLQADLQAAEQEESELEEAVRSRSEELLKRAAAGAVSSESHLPSYSAAHETGDGAAGLRAQAALNGMDPPPISAAGAELRGLRASQERAAHSALRAAWETEVKEHEATSAELRSLEAEWAANREWLLRLTTVTHRWREELLTGMGSAAGGSSSATGTSAQAEVVRPLPVPPATAAFAADVSFPAAVQQLIDCVETLAVESMRRLDMARFASRGKTQVNDGQSVLASANSFMEPLSLAQRRAATASSDAC